MGMYKYDFRIWLNMYSLYSCKTVDVYAHIWSYMYTFRVIVALLVELPSGNLT